MTNPDDIQRTQDVLADLFGERVRQVAKWGNGELHSPSQYLAILTEEVGEVAQEICDHHFREWDPEQLENLRMELVQVGAVAVKMIEAIDRLQQCYLISQGDAHALTRSLLTVNDNV